MPGRIPRRLPEVKSLYEILPKGAEGGKEFARIIDLLLFHEARRNGKKISIFNDSAGDYYGLDSFEGDFFRTEGTTGYQYKFYPSPLSNTHRKEIIESLKKAATKQKDMRLNKWILVLPQDLVEPATRKDKGDVSWFEELRTQLALDFELEHWGHTKLLSLFLQTPVLCLFYYPELTSNSDSRKTIEDTRRRYNDNLVTLYRNIEFVGMSVYKQEAAKGVPMEQIYIPLTVVPETGDDRDSSIIRLDPLKCLAPTAKSVILGDPGSGKSTLLRFLGLVGTSRALQRRYHAKPDKRLPILITLRRFADELKNRQHLSLIDYIQESVQGDFNLKSADLNFFEYYLESGQAILLFDGLDELPSPKFKQTIRNRIRTLLTTYPGNTVLVSSRIVGYESEFRFDDKEFSHYRLTRLQLTEMEKFVKDWYQARIDHPQEREANAQDLIRILNSDYHSAIRELAENPLLLTIVALVHRIDAVLPDERVILYMKCTETLLNTWHTWKYRTAEIKPRGREERRNKRRMEAIANWMHRQSISTGRDQRSVVPYDDLHKFLSKYISDVEAPYDPNNDPEDIASDFLEFIKKKAGLLIEVGDKQYSFVHQTFQEYLTSSFIITTNETEGINGIWREIGKYCDDARWIEVIRLLIAGLQSTASQRVLLEKIIVADMSVIRSQLLGGLLLDGIEPAEIHTKEIISQLVELACSADNHKEIRPLISMLRAWTTKSSDDNEIREQIFTSKWSDSRREREKLALTLVTIALNWTSGKIDTVRQTRFGVKRTHNLLNLFLTNTHTQIDFNIFQKEFEILWEIQNLLSLTSPTANCFAASLDAITSFTPPVVAARRQFEHQLVTLSLLPYPGPFHHYNLNSLSISYLDNKSDGQSVIDASLLASGGKLSNQLTSSRMKALINAISEAIGKKDPFSRNLVMSRLDAKVIDYEWMDDLDRIRIIRGESDLLSKAKGDDIPSWFVLISSPEFYSEWLKIISAVFDLKPLAQWWEAIRNDLFPNIPKRLNSLYRIAYQEMLDDISKQNIKEDTLYRAAWFIILDTWLYAIGKIASPQESPIRQVAALTQSMDAAPIRIAHCIRDLCLGDKSRKSDLISMVNSDDTEYSSLFEAGLWKIRPDEMFPLRTAEQNGRIIHRRPDLP